jgi:LemA protein
VSLSTGQIGILVLAAVLVFWALGAYNRLMAQRNAIAQAWARVAEALQQRATVPVPLVAALREPMAAEHGALDGLLLGPRSRRARGGRDECARPVLPANAQAWVTAEATLAAAATRLMALLDQHPEALAAEPVAGLVATWQEAQARLPFARQLFNQEAQAYNEAVALVPTCWLARVFRFRPAGLL